MPLPSDLQAILDRLNRENARERAPLVTQKATAHREARALAAKMAAEDSTLRHVGLFGSILPGRRFRGDSDIHLAVEGGDRARLERLAAYLSRRVDTVAVDDLRLGVRDRVLSERVVLYGADERRL